MAARWIEEAERKTSCARCKARVDVGQRFYYLRKGTHLCELCGSVAEHEEPEVGEVESGVLEDLKQLPPEASDRTIAKMMVVTAQRIDNGDVADRDIAPLLKEIRQMLSQLKDDYPAEPDDDDTEDRRKRRQRRLLMDGELRD
jgi:hypothetical protein